MKIYEKVEENIENELKTDLKQIKIAKAWYGWYYKYTYIYLVY